MMIPVAAVLAMLSLRLVGGSLRGLAAIRFRTAAVIAVALLTDPGAA